MHEPTTRKKAPPDRSWVTTCCVCCGRPEHVGLLRRVVERLRRKGFNMRSPRCKDGCVKEFGPDSCDAFGAPCLDARGESLHHDLKDDHPHRGPHRECHVDHGGSGVPRHCKRGCPWPCAEA